MKSLSPLLLCALAFPLLAAEEPKKPAPPPPERCESVTVDDPKLKTAIDDCIRRGVNWLKDAQLPTGAWSPLDPSKAYEGLTGAVYNYQPDITALSLLALLKCDVPDTDAHIVRGFAWLRKQAPGMTYTAAICIMALEAKYAPKEAIAPKGGAKTPKVKPALMKLPDEDLKFATSLVGKILSFQHACGGWRYGGAIPTDMANKKPGVADVSATQYAIMGLKLAKRMGVPVDSKVFTRAADFLLEQQESTGKVVARITDRREEDDDKELAEGYGDKVRGWAYMKGHMNAEEATASAGMTCAGLAGIIICRSEIIEDKPSEERTKRLAKIDHAIWDGLAWLDANWSVETNTPRSNLQEFGYYLYALERVGVMADLRYIGPGHDWYLQGAKTWTTSMQEDGKDKGFWAIGRGRMKIELQVTPYGLLFLRKASVKVGYSVGEADEK